MPDSTKSGCVLPHIGSSLPKAGMGGGGAGFLLHNAFSWRPSSEGAAMPSAVFSFLAPPCKP